MAPVNAPLLCPNISDSRSSPGRAAQLTATKALRERRLSRWMYCANSSFPVPLSPVMNTDASVGATLSALLTASRIDAETPRILVPLSTSSPSRWDGWLTFCARMRVKAARPIRTRSCVAVNGLGR